MLRQFSLGSVGLVVGGILSVIGFTAYALDNPTLNLIGFFYGIPLLLGGFALKAAELKPVPFAKPTSPEIVALREQQATSTQNQIRKDVTRYRYGQEAHLDSSLKYLGLSPSDEERPILESIQEDAIDGSYALILEFESPLIKFETWQQKQDKIERFFAPGLRVELQELPDDRVDLWLIATPESASPVDISQAKSS